MRMIHRQDRPICRQKEAGEGKLNIKHFEEAGKGIL